MSNGNNVKIIFLFHSVKVLTVPMRNGNQGVSKWKEKGLGSSYRTYEEWKRTLSRSVSHALSSSYRTYEEWKLTCATIFATIFATFLPYLWGMETIIDNFDFMRWFSFLPYLWGMETVFLYIFHYIYYWFLPYLWGMETSNFLTF